MASYEEDLNRLKNAQRDAAIAGLENTRNQALSNLQAERAQTGAAYNQQRSAANAQNRLSAKNFQEYLAQTGRANSGLSAQARMQNANNLNTNLNYLNAGEAGAIADIGRRQTLAQDAYNTGLAGANAQIEADYIKNLIAERDKELQRQLQERQFQEQIRQFNENMALQREQLYSRFNSGSGGGGGYSGGGETSNNNESQPSSGNKYVTTIMNGPVPVKLAETGKYVNVDLGNKTGTMKVYQGTDGNMYYKNNGRYVRI